MEVKNISTPQIRCIKALVRKLKLQSQEADMVAGFTRQRTESCGDMLSHEANAMIKHLKSQDPDEFSAEMMRKKIISMAHEMGWHIPGTMKADMVRIDNWMQTSSYLKKKINQYTYKELPKLVTQFENVYKSFLNAI